MSRSPSHRFECWRGLHGGDGGNYTAVLQVDEDGWWSGYVEEDPDLRAESRSREGLIGKLQSRVGELRTTNKQI